LKAEPANDRARVRRSAARRDTSWQMSVVSGPAWNGYFGVQVDASGRADNGVSAWIALVETVAAGTDGSAVPRELVRTLSGPFTPSDLRSGGPWQHLLAMRWPETAKPSRLHARAWIENAAGRIVAGRLRVEPFVHARPLRARRAWAAEHTLLLALQVRAARGAARLRRASTRCSNARRTTFAGISGNSAGAVNAVLAHGRCAAAQMAHARP
jgi:hypothetical protein